MKAFANYLTILLVSVLLVNCNKEDLKSDSSRQPPTVSTQTIVNISSTGATTGGVVNSQGGAQISSRGVCWSTSPNPTINNYSETSGSGEGPFNIDLTGLAPNTTYYLKAFATNAYGTSYGVERSFTTTIDTNIVVPCTPVKNTAIFNSITMNYNSTYSTGPNLTYGDYGIVGGATYSTLRIEFDYVPETGIYTIVTPTSFDIGPTECMVHGIFGVGLSYPYSGKAGEKVYVKKNGTGLYSISFCNLYFAGAGTSYTFTTNGNLTTE